MKHQVRIEPEASAEFEDAIPWYDKQHAGLGADFLGAVDATIAHVDRWPESAPPMLHVAAETPVRRVPVPRFPYGVVYLVVDDTIRILAFAHERREPNYWHSRTGGR
ncbi:type II toxin-antitoxin system RelE/ParE family toxin [Jiangella rhizosphaerae]|uniref:type II toxin-antitoxin system RelE/ParE family toxin n=1 Tax=Jiangella rhizosphaerae TaxID=2293569 RepID=UPI001313E16E|nr:type II toxin-antitoxin system RelE/ParE family toxin [Jiangella rhizosphaerae]